MRSNARRAAGLLVAALVAAGCAGPSGSVAPSSVVAPSAASSASGPASMPASPIAIVPTPIPASPTPDLPLVGGTWETGVEMPSRRAENAAVALDGRIYLAGGLDPDGTT